MSEQCPNCLSRRIGKHNYGKKLLVWSGQNKLAWTGRFRKGLFALRPERPTYDVITIGGRLQVSIANKQS